jgi:hypothetical protein
MSIKNVFILPEAVDDLNENIAYVAAIFAHVWRSSLDFKTIERKTLILF